MRARKSALATTISNARRNRSLTAREVAEQIGVTQAAVYFWESDRCRPTPDNLTALCKVLRLPVRATRKLAA